MAAYSCSIVMLFVLPKYKKYLFSPIDGQLTFVQLPPSPAPGWVRYRDGWADWSATSRSGRAWYESSLALSRHITISLSPLFLEHWYTRTACDENDENDGTKK